MARINLLPWRDAERKRRQKEFVVAAGGAVVVAALVVFYVHIHIAGLISTQKSRNDYLTGQIKQVDASIKEIKDLEKKKQQLLARMNVIETLQRNRPEVVHLFDELVRRIPDGLYFTQLRQQGNRLTINGEAQSNARVSAFMRNLDESPWFTNPSLDVIETGRDGTRTFVLKVQQASGPKAGNTKDKKG